MIYDTENQVSLKVFLFRAEQKDAGLPPGPDAGRAVGA